MRLNFSADDLKRLGEIEIYVNESIKNGLPLQSSYNGNLNMIPQVVDADDRKELILECIIQKKRLQGYISKSYQDIHKEVMMDLSKMLLLL